ncbi:conserved hypothetical protein [Vreelandella titanicae]|nr:conserved hypothetical protein [Halomonas sp. 156]VXB33206.1 conserved hypothetical protein [Halomonas titanicae]
MLLSHDDILIVSLLHLLGTLASSPIASSLTDAARLEIQAGRMSDVIGSLSRQDAIQTFHVGSRVIQMAALCNNCLIEQDVG